MDLDPTSLFARVPDVLQNLTWSMLKPERDCAATGAFVAQVVHFKLERNGDQNNYPLHKLSAFIKGCSDVTLAAVSYRGLADWFIYNSAVDSKGLVSLVEKVGNGTWVLDYCKSYNFEGDPDLAGIGVSACVSAPVNIRSQGFVSPELFRLFYVKCYFDIFLMIFVPAYRCVFPASFQPGPEKKITIFGHFRRHQTTIASAALFVFYLLSFAILWIDLVVFGLSRQRAHELAGNSDSEDVWSFGQVVSMTGWLPVIIGLFRVWFCRSFC